MEHQQRVFSEEEEKKRVSVSQSFFLAPETQTRQEGDNMLAQFVPLVTSTTIIFKFVENFLDETEDRTRAPTDMCGHFRHYFLAPTHIFENDNNMFNDCSYQ